VQSVARQVLEPFLAAHAGKISITGQSPVLEVRLVQILSLIFHELATNAVKYGALTQDGGQVLIASPVDDARTINVVWKEVGIAPSEGESRRGYGTELIERLISGAGGQMDRSFEEGKLTISLQFSTP
jgi:two-component sensor histidine kinase